MDTECGWRVRESVSKGRSDKTKDTVLGLKRTEMEITTSD